MKLEDNYYLSIDTTSMDGISIVSSEDQEIFQTVATNCLEVYRGNNVIMFSKNTVKRDTSEKEYYLIYIDSTDALKKINYNLFNKKVPMLSKIDLPTRIKKSR